VSFTSIRGGKIDVVDHYEEYYESMGDPDYRRQPMYFENYGKMDICTYYKTKLRRMKMETSKSLCLLFSFHKISIPVRYRECCDYPKLPNQTQSEYSSCDKKCKADAKKSDNTFIKFNIKCCMRSCKKGQQGTVSKGRMSAAGMVKGFSKAANNDAKWTLTIKASVETCIKRKLFECLTNEFVCNFKLQKTTN